MRHGKTGRNNFARRDIHDKAAIGPPVPPAINRVRPADHGDICGLTILAGKAVQVAAILRRLLGNEGRAPDGLKAVRFADCAKAIEQRRTEDGLTIFTDHDVMDIQIARGVRDLRQVNGVIAVLHLPGFKRVFKPPHLEDGRHPKRIPVRMQAHAALKRALKHGKTPRRLHTQQEQFARLIRRKSQADPRTRQPCLKPRDAESSSFGVPAAAPASGVAD